MILGMVSCNDYPGGVDTPQPPVKEKMRITASAESTRTCLGEGDAVLWQEDDSIMLWAMSENGSLYAEEFSIVEGAGTSQAVFEGYMPEPNFVVDKYYATAGSMCDPTGVHLLNYQYYEPNSYGRYSAWPSTSVNPMVAEYSPESSQVTFRNLLGLMELQVFGSGTITDIIIVTEGGDEFVAGHFDLNRETLELTPNSSYDRYNYLILDEIDVELTAMNTSFYIALPPCTIDELCVYITMEGGEYVFNATNPITITRGEITPVTPALGVVDPTKPDNSQWRVVGSMCSWDVPNGQLMTLIENDTMVAVYGVTLTVNDEFKFVRGKDWNDVNYGYTSDYVVAGYSYPAVGGGGNIRVAEDGCYDLYLDLHNARFYIMNEGDDWRNAQRIEGDVVETIGVMGDFLGNDWNTDIEMESAGDGVYVARGVIFDDSLGEGAVFKIRRNSNWNEAYGVPEYNDMRYCNTAITVSDSYDSQCNILVNAIIGLKYDIWFYENTNEVWVMSAGCSPGETAYMYEFEAPYMFGYKEDTTDAYYAHCVQFTLGETPIYEDWTTVLSESNNVLFSVFYNNITYPARIILDDTTGSCLMSNNYGICCYFTYMSGGSIQGYYLDSAVLNVTEDKIDAYAAVGNTTLHIIYNGPLKLGFASEISGSGITEKFEHADVYDPVWM